MRMRPEVAPASARSWARFPNHWFHGIVQVRNLEGCASAVPRRTRKDLFERS
jgi:hypothetical protein